MDLAGLLKYHIYVDLVPDLDPDPDPGLDLTGPSNTIMYIHGSGSGRLTRDQHVVDEEGGGGCGWDGHPHDGEERGRVVDQLLNLIQQAARDDGAEENRDPL